MTTRFSKRMAEVETLLSTTSLKGADIVPVIVAPPGRGVDELKTKLLSFGPKAARAPPVFSPGWRSTAVSCWRARGVVVTGTVHAGEIRVDDRLLLTPSGLEARVARPACAKNRAAEVGRRRRNAGAPQPLPVRGCRRMRSRRGRLGGEFGVARRPTDRPRRAAHLAPRRKASPLKHWSPVHVHLGSGPRDGPRGAARGATSLAPGDFSAGAARARGQGGRAWPATASSLRKPLGDAHGLPAPR